MKLKAEVERLRTLVRELRRELAVVDVPKDLRDDPDKHAAWWSRYDAETKRLCSGSVELRKRELQKNHGTRIQIDSGIMMPDPADEHRWMLVTYTAATDSVGVFRRCKIDDVKAAEPTEDE